MENLLARFTDMGLEFDVGAASLRVAAEGRLRSIDVQTLPYPGIATDYKPLIITMLSVADGVGIVTENLYPGRFRYVEELIRLGADIRTNGHHAVVRGVPRLSGAPVQAHDIRAGAAMVVAGLAAEGVTVDQRRRPHRPRLRRPRRPPRRRRRRHRTRRSRPVLAAVGVRGAGQLAAAGHSDGSAGARRRAVRPRLVTRRRASHSRPPTMAIGPAPAGSRPSRPGGRAGVAGMPRSRRRTTRAIVRTSAWLNGVARSPVHPQNERCARPDDLDA